LRDARIDLVLSRIEKDSSVINEVIKHLDSKIRSVKFNSIYVLGELDQISEIGISKIIDCLKDDDWSIRRETARTLGKIGNKAEQAIPELSKFLNDKEISIRKEVVIALGKISSSKYDSIYNLINTLTDDSEDVRTEAAKALGEIGTDAHEAIPNLTKSLKDVSWTVRTAAAHAIKLIGKGSTKAIPSLITALEDEDWRVRFRVVNTLAGIGQEAVPNLIKIISHQNPVVRKGAVEALGEMKIADPEIIDNIGKRLNDKIETVRGKAADSLRSIGKPSIPALIDGYHKRSKYRINDFVIPLILLSIPLIGFFLLPWIGFLLVENGLLYGGIISFLGVAIGIIVLCVDIPLIVYEIYNLIMENFFIFLKALNKNYKHKILIIAAIGGIGVDAKEYVTFIIEQLNSGKKFARVEAARSLGLIGIGVEISISALKNALSDPKSVVRREAALSLGKIGLSSKLAIYELINALNDKNPDVRWRASEALGSIGISTEEVLSGLNSLIHDECDYVCEAAINAIDNLTEE
jgi:HEAT repeat protein